MAVPASCAGLNVTIPVVTIPGSLGHGALVVLERASLRASLAAPRCGNTPLTRSCKAGCTPRTHLRGHVPSTPVRCPHVTPWDCPARRCCSTAQYTHEHRTLRVGEQREETIRRGVATVASATRGSMAGLTLIAQAAAMPAAAPNAEERRAGTGLCADALVRTRGSDSCCRGGLARGGVSARAGAGRDACDGADAAVGDVASGWGGDGAVRGTKTGCAGVDRQLCTNGGTSVSSKPYSRCRLISPIAFSQYDLRATEA